MESLEITYNPEESKKIFRKYFQFKQKQELKKLPIVLIFGLCILLILAGILFKVNFFWILGLIIFGCASVFFGTFIIRYRLVMIRFFKELDKQIPESDYLFVFSFDTKEISKKSQNVHNTVKWELINSFEEHENDLYLYLENGELVDIISQSVLGNDLFEKFRIILVEKAKAC